MLLQQYIYIAFSICRLDLVFLKKRQISIFVELFDVAFVYGAFNPLYFGGKYLYQLKEQELKNKGHRNFYQYLNLSKIKQV